MSTNTSTIEQLEWATRKLLSEKRFKDAVPLLESLVEITSGNPEWLYELASVHQQCGMHDAALFTAQKVIASAANNANINNSDASLQQASAALAATELYHVKALHVALQCYMRVHDWRSASQVAEQILQRGSENDEKSGSGSESVEAMCAQAHCIEVLGGDSHRAAMLYRTAVQRDPLCNTALEALFGHHLLPKHELSALVNSLELPPHLECIKDTWRARLGELSQPPQPNPSSPSSSFGVATTTATTNQSQVLVGVPNTCVLYNNAVIARRRNKLHEALHSTELLLRLCPYHRDGICVHLSTLVDLRHNSKLFEFAHALTNQRQPVMATYAVGCYYYVLAQYEKAGKFFCKATEMESTFAPAWIAYAHCYAKLEEGEQALFAYRRAQSMFPGLHCCSAYLGMQYSRVHNWSLGMVFLEEARRNSPNDTIALNEIGVLLYRSNKWAQACQFLTRALESMSDPSSSQTPSEYADCVLFNLATVYRKLKEYQKALDLYTEYIRVRPGVAHGHAALAFTMHLMGDTKAAIEQYHIALGLKADVFCRDMLERALLQEYSKGVGGAAWVDALPTNGSSASMASSSLLTQNVNTYSSSGGGTAGTMMARSSPSPQASFASMMEQQRTRGGTSDSRPSDSDPQSVGRALLF